MERMNRRTQQAKREAEPSNWYRAKLMLHYPWYDEEADLLGGYAYGTLVGDVAHQTDMEETLTLQNVLVVGVPHIDVYKCCLSCRARVEPLTPLLGRC